MSYSCLGKSRDAERQYLVNIAVPSGANLSSVHKSKVAAGGISEALSVHNLFAIDDSGSRIKELIEMRNKFQEMSQFREWARNTRESVAKGGACLTGLTLPKI
jgi:hypothetical protein